MRHRIVAVAVILLLLGACTEQSGVLGPADVSRPQFATGPAPAFNVRFTLNSGIDTDGNFLDDVITFGAGALGATTAFQPAHLVPKHTGWAIPINGSSYIGPTATSNVSAPSGSYWTFLAPFTLPASYGLPVMQIQVHADNMATIYLNGKYIGGHAPPVSATYFQVPAESWYADGVTDNYFQAGANVVQVVLYNEPFVAVNPAGLDFQLTVGYEHKPAILALAPTAPVPVGTVAITGTFSDGDEPDDAHTLDLNCGGGGTALGGVISGSCSFSTPGIYPVSVTITDGTGLKATEYVSVVVYDPSAGFVTGAGWFTSALGACLATDLCTDVEGKASFGFVSKYQKGATVPTGNSRFTFSAGGINFHSAAYDWLVVAGSSANFKGDGTLNGVPGFKFHIWASDGSPDAFRIKLWTEDSGGVENVVYDTGTDIELGGGSIMIHTGK